MELPEQRILGSLILLAGITFLAVGLATGQLTTIIKLLNQILRTAITG